MKITDMAGHIMWCKRGRGFFYDENSAVSQRLKAISHIRRYNDLSSAFLIVSCTALYGRAVHKKICFFRQHHDGAAFCFRQNSRRISDFLKPCCRMNADVYLSRGVRIKIRTKTGAGGWPHVFIRRLNDTVQPCIKYGHSSAYVLCELGYPKNAAAAIV